MIALFAEYRRVLASHPNLVPLAGCRVGSNPHENGLMFLTTVGLNDDFAVELWQSMLAFVVGYSMFSSAQAQSDVGDRPTALAGRMSDWRDDTCIRSLRIHIEGYAETST